MASIMTRVHNGLTKIHISAEARDFSLLQNVHTSFEATQSPFKSVPGFSPEVQQQDMELTSHLHLVTRLRMSGAVLLLPLYTFMT